MHNNRSSQEHQSTGQVKNKTSTPVGHNTNIVAETFVAIICNQLSNMPYIFRNCDLMVLNKSHEKTLHFKILFVCLFFETVTLGVLS